MPLAKRATAEALGTGFLLATVVGSGIMAQNLSVGNTALALLANTLATGAALIALILTFGPISGAHFNPVVTLADALEGGRCCGPADFQAALRRVMVSLRGPTGSRLCFVCELLLDSARIPSQGTTHGRHALADREALLSQSHQIQRCRNLP